MRKFKLTMPSRLVRMATALRAGLMIRRDSPRSLGMRWAARLEALLRRYPGLHSGLDPLGDPLGYPAIAFGIVMEVVVEDSPIVVPKVID